MPEHTDTRAALIVDVTNEMARLLTITALVRARACHPAPRVEPLSAAGRLPWQVSPDMQRRGLSGAIRRANDGAKRADEAFAKFMSAVEVTEERDDMNEARLEVNELHVDYDQARDLVLQLQAEIAAMQLVYNNIQGE